MLTKTDQQLQAELAAAVRSGGPAQAKTTAQDVRGFLGSLINEFSLRNAGGYQSVSTLAERDAIPTGLTLSADGLSAGQRRLGMMVFVYDEQQHYQLLPPNWATLPANDKRAALASNDHWVAVSLAGSSSAGGYQTVATLADRNALPVATSIDPDGLGAGQRRSMMLVGVIEDGKIYQLRIDAFLELDEADKLVKLADNENWQELTVKADTPAPFSRIELSGSTLGGEDLTGIVELTDDGALQIRFEIEGGESSVFRLGLPGNEGLTVNGERLDALDANVIGAGSPSGLMREQLQWLYTQISAGGGSADASFISKTYAELTALMAASSLEVGHWYLISDYQTIHLIAGTTVVCENGVTIGAASSYAGADFAVNGGEPLAVLALAGNRVSSQAFSPSNPLDEISYNVTATTIGNGKTDKGRITLRKDTLKNIETQYDFRTARNRRWKCTALVTDAAATVNGSVLEVPTSISTSTMAGKTVRVTNNSTEVVTTIQFTNKTLPIYNLGGANYYVAGQPYILVFVNIGDGIERVVALSASQLESRILNKYIGSAGTATETIGTYTKLAFDTSQFQDLLTFGNLAGSSNVRLGKTVTTYTNNVVFGAQAVNSTVSDAANSTFVGSTTGLVCEGAAIRTLLITGTVSFARFARGCSSVLLANSAAANMDIQSTIVSTTLLSAQALVTQAGVAQSYFDSDGVMRTITGTSFSSVQSSIISGAYLSCKFLNTIANSYVGTRHDDSANSSLDMTVYAAIRGSIFDLSGFSFNFFPSMSGGLVAGFVDSQDVTIADADRKFYIVALTNGTTTYTQVHY